jgi:hypothetical protein
VALFSAFLRNEVYSVHGPLLQRVVPELLQVAIVTQVLCGCFIDKGGVGDRRKKSQLR